MLKFPRSQLLPTLSLCAMALFSCAKEKDSPSTNSHKSPIHTVPTENLTQAQQLARGAEVTCLGTGDCNPSVGLVSFASPHQAGQCSGSLVAPDVVATNSHCIPDSIKRAGASCKNYIWMNFARNGNQETQIACSKVIYASDISGNSEGDRPDYAFIKLEKPSTRPVLAVNRGGYEDGETYFVNKVNPSGIGRIAGLQTSVACKAIMGSDLQPKFDHSFADTALLADCEIRGGNSGGPVLDRNGEFRGVIFAVYKNDALSNYYRRKEIKVRESLAQLSIATNLACMKIGEEGNYQIPDGCTHSGKRDEERKRRRDEERLVAQEQSFLNILRNETGTTINDFGWKLHKLSGASIYTENGYQDDLKTTVYLPAPLCIKMEAVDKYQQERLITRPKLKKELGLDRYCREDIQLVKTGDNVYDYVNATPAASGEFDLKLRGYGQTETSGESRISLCK